MPVSNCVNGFFIDVVFQLYICVNQGENTPYMW
jgi:hypothetical protein